MRVKASARNGKHRSFLRRSYGKGEGVDGNRLIANKYRLERLLGRGGMGEVWSARHLELDSLLAIKLQLNATSSDAASERRFRREARAAAELRSPHVVHIYDYGVD